jgi:hypothetical protein
LVPLAVRPVYGLPRRFPVLTYLFQKSSFRNFQLPLSHSQQDSQPQYAVAVIILSLEDAQPEKRRAQKPTSPSNASEWAGRA